MCINLENLDCTHDLNCARLILHHMLLSSKPKELSMFIIYFEIECNIHNSSMTHQHRKSLYKFLFSMIYFCISHINSCIIHL